MDNNNSNIKNNNKNNNIDYLSRMISGITDTNSIRPAVTPESIPSFLILNKDTNTINDENFNRNYNTLLNSPTSQESDPSVRDSKSENIYSETEVFHNNKIKKTEISDANKINISNKKIERSFYDSDSDANKINISNKKIERSNSNSDLSYEKVTKSSQSNDKMNAEISNLNKSDNISHNLKLNNVSDISYKKKIMPETYISNKNNIDFERMLYFKNAMNELQKNQTVKRTYEPTITINIGKITIRYIDDNNNNNKNRNNVKDMTNGTRNSNKLSLTDYLKKRAETNR